jgi:hypothetical protein
MASPDIPTIIEYGHISGFLAADDIASQRIFRNSPYIYPDLSRLIYIVTSSVAWANTNEKNPVAASNYLYTLCGKYIPQAKKLIGNIGGIVVTPTQPGSSTLKFGFYETTGTSGQTQITISVANIQSNSLTVTADGFVVPVNQSDRLSYTYVISASNLIISFNQAISDQLITLNYAYIL